MIELVKKIAAELELKEFQVKNAIDLMFTDECTIPFVARYRKERTGSLDEVNLRSVRDRFLYMKDLETSKQKYLKVVEEHCAKDPALKDKFAELKEKFLRCETKQELDDLYLPFKPKRRTRAKVAKEKGLEPLATDIFNNQSASDDLAEKAKAFVGEQVKDVAEALAGASDIIAEVIAETAEYRSIVRRISNESGQLIAQKNEAATKKAEGKKAKDNSKKYENYFEYKEGLQAAPAHRVMAVRRGEAEKALKVNIDVDKDRIGSELASKVIAANASDQIKNFLGSVIEDAYKRLLAPSIETELRLELKMRAELEAIKVFSQNLENLLLLPPLPDTVVMGVDPGLRTGSKLAIVSKVGKYLDSTTIYPQYDKPNSPKNVEAEEAIKKLIKQFQVNYIAIGNGTGGREINKFIVRVIKENGIKDVKRLFVNEAGASVYSTDAIAREEFPDLDPTIRSAVSIARRLQDPLAELVKIDPRSVGVGQYQHDVNVTKLKNTLEEVVESCVNRVGVNLNTASPSLLAYVSNIGPVLAKGIVNYRNENGKFRNLEHLTRVGGMGPKVFTQAVGFLRVPGSDVPLDNSAVHPESYEIVQEIAKDLNASIGDLLSRTELVDQIEIEKYVNNRIGIPTLTDIVNELRKPGRDPRADSAHVVFSDDVTDLDDLKAGMELQGTVTNVTNFGAFVDIGIHQDGLVHISELSSRFVKDPQLVVSVGDILNVKVIDVDLERKRISLSAKTSRTKKPRTDKGRSERGSQKNSPRGAPKNKGKRGPNKKDKKPQYSAEDLLAKFNRRV